MNNSIMVVHIKIFGPSNDSKFRIMQIKVKAELATRPFRMRIETGGSLYRRISLSQPEDPSASSKNIPSFLAA